MPRPQLHRLARKGDVRAVRRLLEGSRGGRHAGVDALDEDGLTPLMQAVESPRAGAEMVRLLLAHGARTDIVSRPEGGILEGASALRMALWRGDPHVVEALLDAGADLRHGARGAGDALLDALGGRDLVRDPHLLDLLALLVERGVASSAVSDDRESALRVLSSVGRYDAVRMLLEAGADEAHLGWSPLIRAVALGSLADVEELLDRGASLETTDGSGRTAWLVAALVGSLEKARLLRARGADVGARCRIGRCALLLAVQGGHAAMLRWLLDLGLDPERSDDHGSTPLKLAVEQDREPALSVLLAAGVDLERKWCGVTPLGVARSAGVVRLLLEAGADPRHLQDEGKRALLGLSPDPDIDALECSVAEYRRGHTRRFGTRNATPMDDPFWVSMVRAGVPAYAAQKWFEGAMATCHGPVWCAQRFGQSVTLLPDGRIVLIGGEHEDYYDAEFCIYNDVFVHHPDGRIQIFGYPEEIFPPTDFHTATLIGDHVYVIGSVGYQGTRRYGQTPVFRLETDTFRMERLQTTGPAPGWLYRHRATPVGSAEIRVAGGKVATLAGEEERDIANRATFMLDTRRRSWRVESYGGSDSS